MDIRGEGGACSRRYRRGRTQWPIQRIKHRPQPEWKATFDKLKDAVNRAPRQITAQTDWILSETWWLADTRTLLQRAVRVCDIEVTRATRDLKMAPQSDRRRRIKNSSEELEYLMTAVQTMEAWAGSLQCYRKSKSQNSSHWGSN